MEINRGTTQELSRPQCIQYYSVYQNDWSVLEVDYIHKYGEQNYKY
jgi:hypothetical protein